MKIIDLLNKIANGEPVKKFKYNGVTYCYTGFEKDLYRSEINGYEFYLDINSFCLNSQVEIIDEDKKIEKLERHIPQWEGELYCTKYNEVVDKINEIIEEIEKIKDDRK